MPIQRSTIYSNKRGSPRKRLGGVENSQNNNPEFNRKHPRNPDGTFAIKEEREEGSNFFKKWGNAPIIELKPNNDWDKIKDIQVLREKAENYLTNTLKKIPLERKEIGKIRFSNKSIDEYIHYSADRDKLLAIPQIPEFIKNGKLGEYFDSSKDRSKKDSITGFYPIYFNLKVTKNISKKAEILIAKDNEGNLFFDMFLDYDRDKAKTKKKGL